MVFALSNDIYNPNAYQNEFCEGIETKQILEMARKPNGSLIFDKTLSLSVSTLEFTGCFLVFSSVLPSLSLFQLYPKVYKWLRLKNTVQKYM